MGNFIERFRNRSKELESPVPSKTNNQWPKESAEVSSFESVGGTKNRGKSSFPGPLSRPATRSSSGGAPPIEGIQCGPGNRVERTGQLATEKQVSQSFCVVQPVKHQPSFPRGGSHTSRTEVRRCTVVGCNYSEVETDGNTFTSHVESHKALDHLHCQECGVIELNLPSFIHHTRTLHGGRGISGPALQSCYRNQTRNQRVRKCEICGIYGVNIHAHKSHLLAHRVQLSKELRSSLCEKTFLVQDIARRTFTLERVSIALRQVDAEKRSIYGEPPNCAAGTIEEAAIIAEARRKKCYRSADRRNSTTRVRGPTQADRRDSV